MSAILDSLARQDAQRSADLDATDRAMNSHVHPLFQQLLKPFAPPAHSFKRVGGTGLGDAVYSECSCGWKGRPVEGWRNYQCSELDAQEAQHRLDQCTTQEMRESGAI